MPVLAQLAVAAAVYAIDRPYSYRVPEDMPLQAGMRVLVPFGRGNRRTEGVVLSLQTGDAAGLKTVERMLDDAPILTGGQLRLAAFMKERYFCTFYEAVKAILPAGFWFDEKKTLTLVHDSDIAVEEDLRERAQNELLRLGATQIVSGHYHICDYKEENGLRIYVDGGHNDGVFIAGKLSLAADGYRLEAWNNSGEQVFSKDLEW